MSYGRMSEDVYAVPDLTKKKVRHGQGEREVEMEERAEEDRGEWEERVVDIYGTAEDFKGHDPDPDPGTQQDAVQTNTAQEQHGDLTKKKVRHGQGEREVQMEERGENEEDQGEWEERLVDIYGTAEDFKGHDPDPGTNTAQEKHGAARRLSSKMIYSRMSEDVYAVPDLTKKKVRHGQGEREVQMEERGENEEDRGEWEERLVDIYGTAEDFKGHDPDPGTNTAQEKHGDPDESKKNRSRVAAVCLGTIITLVLIIMAAVIGVVIQYMVLFNEKKDLTVEKDQLQISFDQLEISFEQLEIRHNNVTEERDQFKISFEQLEIRHSNVTEERDQLQITFDQLEISFEQLEIRHSNVTEERDQLKISFEQLEIRHSNVTEERDQLKISFKQLEIRHNNVTEERDQFKISFEQLQISHSNLTEQKQLLETSFKQLEISYKNLTEDLAALKDALRILCALHGFTSRDGPCYYISTEEKTWEESREWCRDNKSDLMVINSKEEQDFVVGLNQKVWLGLTDIDKEGNWKWVDGTPELITPTKSEFWSKDEPNNGAGRENCADGGGSGGWNDVSCDTKNRWICEIVL